MNPLSGFGLDNRLGSRLLDRLGNRLVGVFVFVIHHVVCSFQELLLFCMLVLYQANRQKSSPTKG